MDQPGFLRDFLMRSDPLLRSCLLGEVARREPLTFSRHDTFADIPFGNDINSIINETEASQHKEMKYLTPFAGLARDPFVSENI